MKFLKGILIAMVILLVVIVAAGGALVGFKPMDHSEMATSDKKTETQNNDKAKDQNTTDDSNTSTNQGNKDQNSDNKDSKAQVVLAEQQIAPEEYLDQMEEAMKLIKEGNELIAGVPYKANSSTQKTQSNSSNITQNNADMGRVYEGIYKLARGTTLMDLAIEDMTKAVKKAKANNINFYELQPQSPQVYYNNPYITIPNQFGQFYQTPNNAYPNVNNQQSNSSNNVNNNQDQSTGNQATTNDPNSNQVMQDQNNNNSTMNHTMGSSFNLNTFTYAAYGILILSVFGIFLAIYGFINSLFKPKVTQQRSEDVAG